MTGFINISPAKSIDLDKAIYRNALQLKKDAGLLAKEGNSYSSATSLLILSSEEIVKGILVFLHSQDCAVYKVKGAKKFFSDHKIRHHIAQFIEVGSGLLEASEKWDERKNGKQLFNIKTPWLNDVFNGLYNVAMASQPLFKSKERIDKIEQFNTLKNLGLYVDYRDGIQVPHNNIDETEYKATEQLVSRIFRFYKGLRILYHPCLKNHMEKSKVEELRQNLEMLISDGLQDFSFK